LPCAKGFFAHGKTFAVCCTRQTAHGKTFAVCCTRQTAHGKQASIKRSFAVCYLSDTRQRVYRLLKSIRQRGFRKLILKTENKKDFKNIQVQSKLQFVTFFAHHAADEIRTHDLSITCNLLYHYTT